MGAYIGSMQVREVALRWAFLTMSPVASSRMARMNWKSQMEASMAAWCQISDLEHLGQTMYHGSAPSLLCAIVSMFTLRPVGSSKLHKPVTPITVDL